MIVFYLMSYIIYDSVLSLVIHYILSLCIFIAVIEIDSHTYVHNFLISIRLIIICLYVSIWMVVDFKNDHWRYQPHVGGDYWTEAVLSMNASV